MIWPIDGSKVIILRDPGPVLIIGPTQDLKDLHQLSCLIVPLEERTVDGQFCENAAYRPDVDGCGVLIHLEK